MKALLNILLTCDCRICLGVSVGTRIQSFITTTVYCLAVDREISIGSLIGSMCLPGSIAALYRRTQLRANLKKLVCQPLHPNLANGLSIVC